MKKYTSIILLIGSISIVAWSQHIPAKFGNGIQFRGLDSTYHIKIGFRFQNLLTNQWDLANDRLGELENHESAILVRRARLKIDGFAWSPKLTFKTELGLSNRDISSGDIPESGNTANIILDAYVRWNFFNNLSVQFGQGKLPGNRERIISSGNLQFVDRSRLNSRFTLDRDMGIQILHHFHLGQNGLYRQVLAISQGEGRNITAGHFGGYQYTFQVEALPLGQFKSKGDYVGSAIRYEESPKLAIKLSYDINNNAVRERGNLGSFIQDETGLYLGRRLTTLYFDLMFKYKNFSFMGEYVHRNVDGSPVVASSIDHIYGIYYTGNAVNIQYGYMFRNNVELAFRFTDVNPEVGTPETQFTLGGSKYVVGHKLKVQTDATFRNIDLASDQIIWRLQMDIHF